MTRIISLSLFIVLFVFGILNAQPRRTPAERAKMLKEQLNLSDKQTAQADSIYTAADSKFKAESQDGFDRAKFRAIMDSTNAEIEKILTPSQQDSFKKFLQERRNRMRRNRPNQN